MAEVSPMTPDEVDFHLDYPGILVKVPHLDKKAAKDVTDKLENRVTVGDPSEVDE